MSFKEKLQQANAILEAAIAKRKLTIAEFTKGGQNITFDEILNLGGQYVEISKGVYVKVIKIISDKIIVLHCIMHEGAELDLHKHSDYKEDFELLIGALTEMVTNTPFTQKRTFLRNEWHKPRADKYSEMNITCTFLGEK